jgi:hypothetical protein
MNGAPPSAFCQWRVTLRNPQLTDMGVAALPSCGNIFAAFAAFPTLVGARLNVEVIRNAVDKRSSKLIFRILRYRQSGVAGRGLGSSVCAK